MSQAVKVSPGLAKLQEEVARWRQVRKLPCPMPGELWERAIGLAADLGVAKVAGALGLNHNVLKSRVEKARKPQSCLATFVELLPTATATTPRSANDLFRECALEVESVDGSLLRVMLKDVSTSSLVSVLRQFAQGKG
jgi:hypothetical protein